MPRANDKWERLVAATLDREKLREIALADSRETSFRTSISSSTRSSFSSSASANFGPRFNFKFNSPLYLEPAGNDDARSILVPTHLTDQVIKAANAAILFKQECLELKRKTQQLELLLKQVASVRVTLYDRPTRRIMDDISELLRQALVLVMKCRSGLMRIFTNIPTVTFQMMSSQLDHSIRNVSWLLGDDKYFVNVPPIAADEPILCHVWELIAILHTGSADDQCNAAVSLVSLALDDDLKRKMIIEEGGIQPLLRLLKKGGNIEGRENAAKVIGLLAKNRESINQMIKFGIRDLFLGILREGPIEVQAAIVWGISEIAENELFEYLFPDKRIFQFFVGYLAYDSVQENKNYAIVISNPVKNNRNIGAREKNDPTNKAYMKAMIAKALAQLARLDSYCDTFLNSSALLHLAILLEQGSEEAQYYSAIALMEISEVAQRLFLLRKSGFRSNSPVHKIIVDQFFRVSEMVDSELIIPCVKIVGNLARIFRATETGMMSPLVKLLDDERKAEVSKEACITLIKFACFDNYLHVDFSKAIISAKGADYLVKLVQFGEGNVIRIHALILLCYIAIHVPESEEFADREVLTVLEWASKKDPLRKDEEVKDLLPLAVTNLERHHSRKIEEYN